MPTDSDDGNLWVWRDEGIPVIDAFAPEKSLPLRSLALFREQGGVH